MTVPVFQDLTLPVLRASANGDIAMRDVVEKLREELRLSDEDASDFLSKRIVLIDGVQLTKLMIRYDVGCRIEETLFIKRLDEEFFD